MSKKRNSGKKTGRRSWKRAVLSLILKLSLVAIVIGGAGLVYLDAQVREKFEGKRWALPAKVYARPLELYPGQQLSADDLQLELKG